MKKSLFLFLVFLFIMLGSSAQIKKDTIIVDGFNGNKPLKQNTYFPVRFSTDPHADIYLLEAYKGETKQKFIARLKDEQRKYRPVYRKYKNSSKPLSRCKFATAFFVFYSIISFGSTYLYPFDSMSVSSASKFATDHGCSWISMIDPE